MRNLTFSVLARLLLAGPSAPARTPRRDSETVIVSYCVKEGQEDEFVKFLRRQWPTLRKLGLMEPRPHLIFRGRGVPKDFIPSKSLPGWIITPRRLLHKIQA